MIYIHNSKNKQLSKTTRTEVPLLLSEKGVKQAQRNQSDDIWNLMNWCSQSTTSLCVCYYCGMNNCEKCQLSLPNQGKYARQQGSLKKERRQSNDYSSIPNNKSQRDQIKQINNQNFQRKQQNGEKIFQRSNGSRSKGKNKSVSFKGQNRRQGNTQRISQQQTQLTEQQIIKRQKYMRQCYSLQKYLQNTKAYTRTMPNSAIRLFYEKPCFESYGQKNTPGNNGFIYNDYLKTHNMQPHRHENDPKKYQTYRSALNFGKRTKLDPEERMKKIHRQFSSKLDMKALVDDFSIGYIPVTDETLNETLRYNIDRLKPESNSIRKSRSTDQLRNFNKTIDLNSTAATGRLNMTNEEQQKKLQNRNRRVKSAGKKQHLFLYRYKDEDGDTQYCKDRHGITCFVDPTFEENREAYSKFLKKIKPIYAEDVKKEDRGIDKIMIGNYLRSKQEDVPNHYLMPNCQEPYRPQKYSVKSRKKSLAVTNTSSKLQEVA